jgi:hypothetical protein
VRIGGYADEGKLEMVGHHLLGRSPRKVVARTAMVALLAVLVGPPSPVVADAGADLVFSTPAGPAGTTVEVYSSDAFNMNLGQCPSDTDSRPVDTGDRFEVRWELALLPPAVSGSPTSAGGGHRYVTFDVPIEAVLGAGVVRTESGVAWAADVRIPVDVAAGRRLTVRGSCWRIGPRGEEEEWFPFAYLPVYTVTGADGSVPPPSSPSTTPAASSVPDRAPGASARPGAPSYTG